jgi:ABC-type transport system substrate-binding protein
MPKLGPRGDGNRRIRLCLEHPDSPGQQAADGGGGKGQFVVAFGTLVERIEMNTTDPSADLPEGERSTAKHPHPILSDIKVRTALSMAIDRRSWLKSAMAPAASRPATSSRGRKAGPRTTPAA